jgi:sodium transport system permease protein
MKAFISMFKKEWLVLIKDRRSLVSTLIVSCIFMPTMLVLPSFLLVGNTVSQLSKKLDIAVSGLDSAPSLATYVKQNGGNLNLVPVEDVEDLVRRKEYQVGIVLPANFEADLAALKSPRVQVISQQGQMVDTQMERVSALLENFRLEVVQRRLQDRNLPAEFARPFEIETRQIASEGRFQRSYIGWLTVFILVFSGFSLGMSKAIGLTAGEKEHLTMEALLLSPASRIGMILGKIFFIVSYALCMVLASSISIAVISIVSLVIILLNRNPATLGSTPAAASGASATASAITFLPKLTIPGVLVVCLLALICFVLFIEAQVIVGLWARNESQAGNILTFATMLPGAVSIIFFLPSYEPVLWHYAIPILGQVLLIPDLIMDRWDPLAIWINLAGSLVVLVGLALLGGWMMRREEIILRT